LIFTPAGNLLNAADVNLAIAGRTLTLVAASGYVNAP
jgi:hypothetical protein